MLSLLLSSSSSASRHARPCRHRDGGGTRAAVSQQHGKRVVSDSQLCELDLWQDGPEWWACRPSLRHSGKASRGPCPVESMVPGVFALALPVPRVLAHYALALSQKPPPSPSTTPHGTTCCARSDPGVGTSARVLGWLLLAIVLWATDFWHHISPARHWGRHWLAPHLARSGRPRGEGRQSGELAPHRVCRWGRQYGQCPDRSTRLAPLSDLIGTWHDTLMSTAWRATLTL